MPQVEAGTTVSTKRNVNKIESVQQNASRTSPVDYTDAHPAVRTMLLKLKWVYNVFFSNISDPKGSCHHSCYWSRKCVVCFDPTVIISTKFEVDVAIRS